MEDLGGRSGPGGPKGISVGAEGVQGSPRVAQGGSRGVQGATLEASENGPKNGGGFLWLDGTLLGSAAVARVPAEG